MAEEEKATLGDARATEISTATSGVAVDTSVAIDLEDDPHKAALERNPDEVHVSFSVWASIAFMSLSFAPAIGIVFVCLATVVQRIAQVMDAPEEATWIVGAWSLSSAISFSLAGPLSDCFGRRGPILSGQALITLGAVVGCTAQNINAIIAGQTLLGLGTGFLFVSYAGVPEMLPNKWRALGLGLLEVGIACPWATVSGLIGNYIYTSLGWRWFYYIAVILGTISLIGTAIFYRPVPRPRNDFDKSRWQRIKELDLIGLFLFASGLAIFLIGVTWGGTTAHPWKSTSTIVPIVLGVIVVCSVFVWEAFATNPIFPLRLLAQFRQFSLLLLVLFVSAMNFYSMTSLLPQGSFYMFSTDPVAIGVIALPNNLATVITGIILPVIAHKIGYVKYQLIGALTLELVFMAASVSSVDPLNKALWMALPAIGVPVFTWLTILAYAIAGLHVPHSNLGVAVGLLGTFRATGGAVGNAIFNTIFNNRFNDLVGPEVMRAAIQSNLSVELAPALIPAAIEYNLGLPSNGLLQIAGVTPEIASALQAAVRQAYAGAFKLVFYCTIPFGVLALVGALFVEDSTRYMTNHVQQAMGESSKLGRHRTKEEQAGKVTHVE